MKGLRSENSTDRLTDVTMRDVTSRDVTSRDMMRDEVRTLIILGAALLFAVLLHSVYMGALHHVWLGWNVFLALVPWFLSLAAEYVVTHRRPVLLWTTLAGWLLFFPNAPYIVTDLIHMPSLQTPLWWYYQMVLVGGAVVGLTSAYYSWRRVRRVLDAQLGRKWSTVVMYACIYAAAFGVYLGRFSRWNSWDAFVEYQSLFADIAHRFFIPTAHPRTWMFTIMFGSALALGASLVGTKHAKAN